ncbi:MAG: Rpn family recombination-promoting nuclease/putative transposase [Firmicutes bacterium]|nr:Rpn family recombination-promoting nuclease/putative transposase [Bacillota bacterium]
MFIDEETAEQIKEYRLIDDIFFNAFFDENKKDVEFILKIILEKDLEVIEMSVQKQYKNIRGRSAELDIVAKDSDNKIYDIEIQRASDGAIPKRARFHSSMLDSAAVKRGMEYDELPETYVIFITETDIFKKSKPIYKVERCIMDEEIELFNDMAHILYVNGENDNDTELGRLMQDFMCSDPDKMHNPNLAERARFFKQDEGGRAIMAMSMEDIFKKGEHTRAIQGAIRMLKAGKLTVEEIAEYQELPLEEVIALEKQVKAVPV